MPKSWWQKKKKKRFRLKWCEHIPLLVEAKKKKAHGQLVTSFIQRLDLRWTRWLKRVTHTHASYFINGPNFSVAPRPRTWIQNKMSKEWSNKLVSASSQECEKDDWRGCLIHSGQESHTQGTSGRHIEIFTGKGNTVPKRKRSKEMGLFWLFFFCRVMT